MAKTRKKNYCEKHLEGDYELLIYGKGMILVDTETGDVVSALCHPDDEFDINYGVSLLLSRMRDKRGEWARK